MDSKIDKNIFEDTDFLELDNECKLLFFWMLCNCTLLGVVEATPRKINRDIEYKDGNLEALCKGLPRGIVKTDRGYWIKNYIRRQIGSGSALSRNNISKSAARELLSADPDVQELVLEGYPEFIEVIDSIGEQLPAKPHDSMKGLTSPHRPHTKGEEKEKEKEKEKEGGVGETNPTLEEPADTILKFPVQKRGEFWCLTQSKCDEWAESYPGVNILATCRIARQWCIDNPAKRKTPKGMANFLGGWIRRSLDRGQAVTLSPGQPQEWVKQGRQSTGSSPVNEERPPANWRSALLIFFTREGMKIAAERLKADRQAYSSWSEVNSDFRDEVIKIARSMGTEGGDA